MGIPIQNIAKDFPAGIPNTIDHQNLSLGHPQVFLL